ncbi:DUF805 domain-containing protein [Rahnella sikkimica]|uniref:DUF805 domain-containing protein n=1 Tax=Rahnella sikkimica TaxID=1805933 RepID=A0A2L1UWH7_9GAMM|nr:DUF805 domain-containing protein [Rahnella sikkimica]AVF37224.1 hypothetical protein BV494_21000 [Rahnella sikkimica]
MNWYIKALKNYATFSGRAKRREYWWFVLFNWLISMAIGLIAGLLGDPFIMIIIYTAFILVPSLALSVRRNHDAGYSGWWILCPFFNFFLMFFKSDPEDNRFGPYPAETQA